jgi:hypothetical protein
MVRSLSMPEHSGDENVIASTLELILMMVVREGAEQEKAQLISQIVSSVVVQSDALQVQISKGALGAGLLGARISRPHYPLRKAARRPQCDYTLMTVLSGARCP